MTGSGATGAHRRLWDWTPLARAYARIRVGRLDRLDPAATQRAVLARLVRRARDTRFGRAHGFAGLSDVAAYQRNVPVRDYEDFWTGWWRDDYPDLVNVSWPGRIPFFAMTSGTTTGRSKFIPYTPDMRRAAIRGFVDLLCFHLARRPESRLLGGAALGLTGPTALDRRARGVRTGAVSAIAAGAAPFFLKDRVLPPDEIANLPDWEEKIRRLAAMAAGHDIRLLGGSPNWMLVFLSEMARTAPGAPERLVSWFPELELIVHGGVNFAPYRDRFRSLMDGSHAETREMYSASEGVFAIADRGDGEGLRLQLNGSVFFEFIPVADVQSDTPERFWIGNAVTGRDYALAVSTAAGLWSYLVGDIVRLVDLNPPRLIVMGRTRQGLSEFGEHLIEAEISEAVAAAAARLGLSVLDFSVGAVRAAAGGHHLYLIETDTVPDPGAAAAFAEQIDRRLKSENEDYAEYRAGDLAISAPEVRFVRPGGFAAWMKARRQLGGQNKIPRIVIDPELFRDLQDTLGREGGSDAG